MSKIVGFKANVNIQDRYGNNALLLLLSEARLMTEDEKLTEIELENYFDLLMSGENIDYNHQNNHGETLLTLAVYHSQMKIVEKLLKLEGTSEVT